jgi:hypothetical protein
MIISAITTSVKADINMIRYTIVGIITIYKDARIEL